MKTRKHHSSFQCLWKLVVKQAWFEFPELLMILKACRNIVTEETIVLKRKLHCCPYCSLVPSLSLASFPWFHWSLALCLPCWGCQCFVTSPGLSVVLRYSRTVHYQWAHCLCCGHPWIPVYLLIGSSTWYPFFQKYKLDLHRKVLCEDRPLFMKLSKVRILR